MRTPFRFGVLFTVSLVAFAALTLLAMLLVPAAAAEPAAPQAPAAHEVLVPGLASPRDLVWHDGALYVGLAGSGGPEDGTCFTSSAGSYVCLGETGKVIRVDFDAEMNVISWTDVVTGLPSLAIPGAPVTGVADATGVHGIAFDATDKMYVSMGLGSPPLSRTQVLSGTSGELLGQLVQVGASGAVTPVADLAAYEQAFNPDNGLLDSNPWYMREEGGTFYVTDAGGNDLLEVEGSSGTVDLAATFPFSTVTFMTATFPMQPVPTGVDMDPNGNLFVGELTGFPFPPGAADVYEVHAGGTVSVAQAGFTNITDIAFDAAGNLYVLEIAANGLASGGPPVGAVIQVRPDGKRRVLADDLFAPTGLTVGPDGALYISNIGVSNGAGQVVRVQTGYPVFLPVIKRMP